MRYPSRINNINIGSDDLDEMIRMPNQEQQYSDYEEYRDWEARNINDENNKQDEDEDSLDSLDYENDSSSNESIHLSKNANQSRNLQQNRLTYSINDFLVIRSGYFNLIV